SPSRGRGLMVQLGELMMILELHRQGLSITAIARRTGRDPKTVRKYIERGIEAPVYRPRSVGRPSKLAPFIGFLRERIAAFPDLSAARLTRELRELGYAGALYRGEALPGSDPTGERTEALRGALRDTAWRSGAGRLCAFRRGIYR